MAPHDPGALSIERVATAALSAAQRRDTVALCTAAYAEEFAPYFAAIGPGVHLLGRVNDTLVAHAMWVTRWLQPAGRDVLRTAYVEAVATHPAHERRGYASALLRRIAREASLDGFDLAALSPSDERFYARLGWQVWRGSLAIREKQGVAPTPSPDEGVMILRLARTPADLDVTAPLSAEWRAGEVW
jgi:GNAT superfamily N-acetyltransferase